MPGQERDDLDHHLLTLGVREGAVFGVTMAAGLSLYAVALFAVVGIVRLIARPADLAAELPGALLLLFWIALGYFGAFALAGALLGLVNAVGAGALRYPLAGFVLGTAIYGGVGVAMKLGGLFGSDEPPPGWGFVGGMALGMGALWAILGAGLGVVRWRQARKRRRAA